MSTKEIRCAALELRAEGTNSKPRIAGLAARFGAKTTIAHGLNEVIAKGAFKRSISEGNDVVLNFNHSDDKVCARVAAGTLTLRETDAGLAFDAEVDLGISYVSDLYKNIRAGNIAECSFAFIPYADGDSIEADPSERGAMLRTLRAVKLYDVSAVTFPAYGSGATNVSARTVLADGLEQRARLAAASSVEVSERDLAHARARLELAKRIS